MDEDFQVIIKLVLLYKDFGENYYGVLVVGSMLFM